MTHSEPVDSVSDAVVPIDSGGELTTTDRGVEDGHLMMDVIFVVVLETRQVLEIEMQRHVEIRRRPFGAGIPQRRSLPGLDLEQRSASLEEVGPEIDGMHRRASITQIGEPLEHRNFAGGVVVSLNRNKAVCLRQANSSKR